MLDALIIGAGIAGLTAACALTRRGLSVRIVERQPAVASGGAGLLLAGNARACLAELGLFAALEPRGRWITDMAITDAAGRMLGGLGAREAGDPAALFGVHRRALHASLHDGVGDAVWTYDATVEALDPSPDAVRATLSTGEAVTARLILGADGIGSRVRNLAFGPPSRIYAGYTCWRVVVPDPGLARAAEMWGRGQRIGLVPVAEGQVYVFLVENAPPGSWATTTTPDELRQRFSAFGGDAPAVLDSVDVTTDILHQDIDHIPAHAYAHGRIGLLGDAAHALTPNMGQGAAMAIEDAVVLAREIATHGPTPTALEAFERVRAPRVRDIAQRSLRIGQVGQWAHPLACGLRTLMLRLVPRHTGVNQVRALVAAGPSASFAAS